MPYTTFKQGIRDCLPTVLGYAGVGFSFGIVSVASGFNILEILLLSLLVYAGAAQFNYYCAHCRTNADLGHCAHCDDCQ